MVTVIEPVGFGAVHFDGTDTQPSSDNENGIEKIRTCAFVSTTARDDDDVGSVATAHACACGCMRLPLRIELRFVSADNTNRHSAPGGCPPRFGAIPSAS